MKVVSFTPWSLYSLGQNSWYLSDRRLGGPHMSVIVFFSKIAAQDEMQILVFYPDIQHISCCKLWN